MSSSEDVRQFYDHFSRDRLQTYRVTGNRRIDLAVSRAAEHVDRRSRILEIGCGTGIATAALAARARDGLVLGSDISRESIADAVRHVHAPNARFVVWDVLGETPPEVAELSGTFDVLVLIDVVEHVPVSRHVELFRRLGEVAAESATIVLTFPTPAYQAQLREHHPEELQVVDEDVHLDALVREGAAAGFSVVHYSVHDVWRTNQYAHCVLRRPLPVDEPVNALPAAGRWWGWLAAVLRRLTPAVGQKR